MLVPNGVSSLSLHYPSQNSKQNKSIPAFLNKLYCMVNEKNSDSLIRWTEDGLNFVVTRQEEFSKEVLPRFFKHNNFASFVRQLNMYGFHKIPHLQAGALFSTPGTDGAEHWEFTNPFFRRDRPDLIVHMRRKTGKDAESDNANGNGGSGGGSQNDGQGSPLSSLESASDIHVGEDGVLRGSNGVKVELKSVLSEISAIKRHQEAITHDLANLQRDNQLLWSESLNARSRHQRQQETIDKIVRFLASVFTYDGKKNSLASKKQRLMIEETDPDCSFDLETDLHPALDLHAIVGAAASPVDMSPAGLFLRSVSTLNSDSVAATKTNKGAVSGTTTNGRLDAAAVLDSSSPPSAAPLPGMNVSRSSSTSSASVCGNKSRRSRSDSKSSGVGNSSGSNAIKGEIPDNGLRTLHNGVHTVIDVDDDANGVDDHDSNPRVITAIHHADLSIPAAMPSINGVHPVSDLTCMPRTNGIINDAVVTLPIALASSSIEPSCTPVNSFTAASSSSLPAIMDLPIGYVASASAASSALPPVASVAPILIDSPIFSSPMAPTSMPPSASSAFADILKDRDVAVPESAIADFAPKRKLDAVAMESILDLIRNHASPSVAAAGNALFAETDHGNGILERHVAQAMNGAEKVNLQLSNIDNSIESIEKDLQALQSSLGITLPFDQIPTIDTFLVDAELGDLLDETIAA